MAYLTNPAPKTNGAWRIEVPKSSTASALQMKASLPLIQHFDSANLPDIHKWSSQSPQTEVCNFLISFMHYHNDRSSGYQYRSRQGLRIFRVALEFIVDKLLVRSNIEEIIVEHAYWLRDLERQHASTDLVIIQEYGMVPWDSSSSATLTRECGNNRPNRDDMQLWTT